uniref:Uncharacterized protein n=1 Tax=Arundo donax TaxID=35708 RepID=A0A0A9GHT6_ARUDO
MPVHATTSLVCISSNTLRAATTDPHPKYMLISAVCVKRWEP